uniref:Uncharacterized protein n=1 Tax=Picea glauca TaxID=3330 RepID=A0A124GNN8_PICGL|nr:hypothetical protein ABT39_MTgene3980 [Picea glauca]QHR86976.1 hypothetical protein Q903MT_gene985 [Picea sitchensis]
MVYPVPHPHWDFFPGRGALAWIRLLHGREERPPWIRSPRGSGLFVDLCWKQRLENGRELRTSGTSCCFMHCYCIADCINAHVISGCCTLDFRKRRTVCLMHGNTH